MSERSMVLRAAAGLLLLGGHSTASLAHLVEDSAMWSPDRHAAYRNIRYCDADDSLGDYMAGGKYSSTAQAYDDGVVFEKVSFLTGSEYYTRKFLIDAAGTYEVTLTDFEFPGPLESLGLNVTSATESFGSLIGSGDFTFDAEPGRYYLSFFGEAPDLGQYGIEIAQYGILISETDSVSAVPVPAAAWLFGSGLLSLAGFIRHHRSR